MRTRTLVCIAALLLVLQCGGRAEDDAADLAKKLANPVSALISVPFQFNYDENIGPDEKGSVWRLNIQPVIPISLNEEWNLISRTIVPLIDQDDVPMEGMGESGMGDILQSFFFSPVKPTANGWIWGAGPVLLLPSASDDALGGEKWGAGPTAVALKQIGPWTYGALVNHIWSFAGDSDRDDVNATFVQPFLAYVTSTKTTLSLNMENTYNWETDKWSAPANLMVSQMLKLGSQLFQVGAGVRYWVDSPDGAADDWGFRFQVVLLFPK